MILMDESMAPPESVTISCCEASREPALIPAMPRPVRQLHVLSLVATFLLAMCGCSDRIAGYTAASAISANGFARNPSSFRDEAGREIRLWGFVDPSNLYGDEDVKNLTGEWWSGPATEPGTWRFNLKANVEDERGHSFPVIVPDDAGRDALLRFFIEDAIAGKPTRVYLTGRIFTYDAPSNLSSRVGLTMRLQSSRDILLDPAEKP